MNLAEELKELSLRIPLLEVLHIYYYRTEQQGREWDYVQWREPRPEGGWSGSEVLSGLQRVFEGLQRRIEGFEEVPRDVGDFEEVSQGFERGVP